MSESETRRHAWTQIVICLVTASSIWYASDTGEAPLIILLLGLAGVTFIAGLLTGGGAK